MKKKKRIILGSAIGFIILICLQVFSTGHGHVVVVEKNEVLTEKNETLTTANKTLTKNVSSLKAKNESLVEEKAELTEMVTEISGSLDSTKQAAEEYKMQTYVSEEATVKSLVECLETNYTKKK